MRTFGFTRFERWVIWLGIAAIAVAILIFIAPAPIGTCVAFDGNDFCSHSASVFMYYSIASCICAAGVLLVIWGINIARRPSVKVVAEP